MIAAHLVFGAYGFWLPNDPRGSGSRYVGSTKLFAEGGKATKVNVPWSVAKASHDRRKRLSVKEALKYPAVKFDGHQAVAIARGFAKRLEKLGLTARACTIMPDHVHLVLDVSRYRLKWIANQLKGAATTELIEAGLHPFLHLPEEDGEIPKCWQRGEWKVFIDDDIQLFHTIHYVEDNPLEIGKPRQVWWFVDRLEGTIRPIDEDWWVSKNPNAT